MKFVCLSRVGLACVLLAALLVVTVGATANLGQPFSGYFDVSGVQKQGDIVQVTLHLKMFNHSNEDVTSVIVALFDNEPIQFLRGNFQPVKVWKSQKFIQISQEFSVPQREYDKWFSGPGQPNLVILFQDANGNSLQRGVQISRRPLVAPGS
jgi:hypothetical protein